MYLDESAIDGYTNFVLPNKMMLGYPVLERTKDFEYSYLAKNNVRTKIYGGKVIENVCQALARIVIGEQLLRVAKKYKVVMTVHDAIGCIVPEAEVNEGMAYVKKCMRVRPLWAPDLPLACEGGFGRSYGDCSVVAETPAGGGL